MPRSIPLLPRMLALLYVMLCGISHVVGESEWYKLEYSSMTRVSESYKVYHNLWMHNGRWYMFLAPENVSDPLLEEGLSTNIAAVRHPVKDLKGFLSNLEVTSVPGNSLIVDFPFPSYPDSLAHWIEILVPTFSVLYDEEWTNETKGNSTGIDNVLFPNLSKHHFSSFFSSILAVAISPGIQNREHPTLVDWSELDQLGKLGWLWVENLLVVTDRYTHPQRKIGFPGPEHGDLWRYDGCDRWISPTFKAGFLHPSHALDFRDAAYLGEDMEVPAEWVAGEKAPPIPKQITFILDGKEKAPPIENPEEVMAMLEEVAAHFGLEARMTRLTSNAPFTSFLDTVANTGILIGRHSPLLASSIFLPPGAAVYELLPFKWEWHNISALFYNITESMGDIHHFAWRPVSEEFCVYKDKVGKRYKDWYPSECHAKECLTVFASAGLIVDVEPLRELMMRTLPGVLEGKSVAEVREPWPIPV